ncbi:O-antigen ligase family protein [Candidatus Parcubacteria bacterium]|nr:O-antigen ligase family protein [Candidatus Parcubacteria bacterium]
MLLDFKKIKLEYLAVILMAVFSGFAISFYNLSILFLLVSILFTIISFKYFKQVLIILIFYLPFQIALNITSGIDLASGRAFILYLFIVWIIKSLAEKRFIIKFNLQAILILAFLFIAIFSMTQAWDSERAIRKILVFLSVFPLYFIITSVETRQCLVSTVANKKYISKILSTLILSGFILSLIGVIQFALQFLIGIDPIIIFWSKYIAPLFYGNTFGAEVISNPSWLVNIGGATVLRAFSLFPDPHMFSFYLGLLIPIALACWLHSPYRSGAVELKCVALANRLHSSVETMEPTKIFNSNFLYLALITMLFAELLTFSRGGYLGMIFGVGTVVILLWRQIAFKKKIILGLISATAIIFLLTTSQSILSRFLSSFNFNEGSNTERLKNWNQGSEMFADNFFFGVGIGNYSLEINPTIEYRSPVYAHNLYLDIGAEMGIFALIVWILLIIITIFQLYKTSKNSDNEFSKVISVGLIGSLVWFSVHSIFDTPIYSPTILGIFVIILSLSSIILNSKYAKS